MAFEDASVIITGASRGIGLSIAKVFARNTNRRLVLIARSYNDLQKAKEALMKEGAKGVEILAADLSSTDVLNSMDFESLNPGILINNAGVYLHKTLRETTVGEFEHQFNVNAKSTFMLTQKVLPALQKQERGLIVNISSQAALFGFGDSGAYTMSKHALLGYTRSLRKELMQSSIAVSAINLGQTYSSSWDGIDVDTNKLIDPEDVGRLILTLSQLSPRSVAEEILLQPQGGQVNPV